MLTFLNLIIFTLQIILLIKAILVLKKNALDFGALFIIIYIVFYVPVVYDMYFDWQLFSYVYKIVGQYNVFASKTTITYFNFITTLIMLSFEIGYSLKRKNKKVNVDLCKPTNYVSVNYYIIQCLCFTIWLVIMVNLLSRYNGDLIMFFTPSSKDVYGSYYEKYISFLLPIIMLTLKRLKVYHFNNKKIDKTTVFYVLLVLASSVPSGQRREIINQILYISLLFIVLPKYSIIDYFKGYKNKQKNQIQTKVLRLGLFIAALVPFFWYGRVWFNQIQRGASNITPPWEVRGVFEVLFGSSSTGFPTIIALNNYYETIASGLPYFRNVIYLITSPIPSAIYSEKLAALTEEVQNMSNAGSNLSLFYITDMYLTFGPVSIFVSFLVGYILSVMYNRSLHSIYMKHKVLALIALSQIVLLYKNGVTEFVIKMTLYLFLMIISINLIFPTKKSK
ncbi:hypothetical protein [Halobacillus campisalis]|uniref:Oligosaccharide repeat unit polymerase n=1 Tax=Halobacillus campisalis TaxID=435909 RepID=A0ABW2JYX3_9BACI|nr:hypothetical protein [Halobacillus campisalis]